MLSSVIPSRLSIHLVTTALLLFVSQLIASSIISTPTVEGKYVFSNKWGELGSEAGQFKGPTSIALGSSVRAYVVDSGNNRIQIAKFLNDQRKNSY